MAYVSKKVIVLGIGNILLKDEGFGIHVVNELKRQYNFPSNVEVIDGGTAGINLLSIIETASHLILIDVVQSKKPPGTIFRFKPDKMPKDVVYKRSLHQIGFNEIFGIANILEKFPDTTIIGIQPMDIKSYEMDLTPELKKRVKDVVEIILMEIEGMGCKVKPR